MTYIYIYIYIYIKFSLCLYTGMDYSLGVEGEVSLKEQAGVCSGASIYKMYILYVYLSPLSLYHYDEYASDQQGVPVSDAGWEAPSSGTCLSLAWSCCRRQGWEQPHETGWPCWIHPSSNPPRKFAQKAPGCGPAASSPEVMEPTTQSGEGPSMLLAQDMAFPARWRQGTRGFCLPGGRWPLGTQSRDRTWWSPALCSSATCRGRWRGWRRAAWWTGGRWRRRARCCWRPRAGTCEWPWRGAKAVGACGGEAG